MAAPGLKTILDRFGIIVAYRKLRAARQAARAKLGTFDKAGTRIIIYQMGKVGSTTLYTSLKRVLLDVHHTHLHEEARALIAQAGGKEIVVICGIREPVAQAISSFFQNIDEPANPLWYFGSKASCLGTDRATLVNAFRTRLDAYINQVMGIWIDDFCQTTGIARAHFVRDENHGHFTARRDNLTVHIYRFEELARFIGLLGQTEPFKKANFKTRNVSEDKWSGELQAKLKEEFAISDRHYEQLINKCDWLLQFYTMDELKALASRYINSTG